MPNVFPAPPRARASRKAGNKSAPQQSVAKRIPPALATDQFPAPSVRAAIEVLPSAEHNQRVTNDTNFYVLHAFHTAILPFKTMAPSPRRASLLCFHPPPTVPHHSASPHPVPINPTTPKSIGKSGKSPTGEKRWWRHWSESSSSSRRRRRGEGGGGRRDEDEDENETVHAAHRTTAGV